MRALVAFRPDVSLPRSVRCARVTKIGGDYYGFGLADVPEPVFEPDLPENHKRVLLRVLGVSLNYRDLAVLRHSVETQPAVGIGSDFVGVILRRGSAVRQFNAGDRVFADMSWSTSSRRRIGVPTNAASVEVQAIHEDALREVPASMPNEVAAAFSLCSQTVYSMLRRLRLSGEERLLVTAAGSNVGYHTIEALKNRTNVEICAATTSGVTAKALRNMNVSEVAQLESPAGLRRAFASHAGGTPFSAAVDPWADIYMNHVVPLLGFGGRYITCGAALTGRASARLTRKGLTALIVRNLTITGNCLGSRSDLTAAIADWTASRFTVRLDSIHRGSAVHAFISRTFCSPNRLGKVVYLYD